MTQMRSVAVASTVALIVAGAITGCGVATAPSASMRSAGNTVSVGAAHRADVSRTCDAATGTAIYDVASNGGVDSTAVAADCAALPSALSLENLGTLGGADRRFDISVVRDRATGTTLYVSTTAQGASIAAAPGEAAAATGPTASFTASLRVAVNGASIGGAHGVDLVRICDPRDGTTIYDVASNGGVDSVAVAADCTAAPPTLRVVADGRLSSVAGRFDLDVVSDPATGAILYVNTSAQGGSIAALPRPATPSAGASPALSRLLPTTNTLSEGTGHNGDVVRVCDASHRTALYDVANNGGVDSVAVAADCAALPSSISLTNRGAAFGVGGRFDTVSLADAATRTAVYLGDSAQTATVAARMVG